MDFQLFLLLYYYLIIKCSDWNRLLCHNIIYFIIQFYFYYDIIHNTVAATENFQIIVIAKKYYLYNLFSMPCTKNKLNFLLNIFDQN